MIFMKKILNKLTKMSLIEKYLINHRKKFYNLEKLAKMNYIEKYLIKSLQIMKFQKIIIKLENLINKKFWILFILYN